VDRLDGSRVLRDDARGEIEEARNALDVSISHREREREMTAIARDSLRLSEEERQVLFINDRDAILGRVLRHHFTS